MASAKHIFAINGDGWSLNALLVYIDIATVHRPINESIAATVNNACLYISTELLS